MDDSSSRPDWDVDDSTLNSWLFAPAELDYPIPFPTEGHKLFECDGCGVKFIIESVYDYHISRELIQITYMCRVCNTIVEFKNRCKFLQHLKSHAITSETINHDDLTVRPLPLEHFTRAVELLNSERIPDPPIQSIFLCTECKECIPYNNKDSLFEVRAKHFERLTDKYYRCSVCLYTLPNACALFNHMEAHLKHKPYVCCDCGRTLANDENILCYPYNHECEGFRAMRVCARIKCPTGAHCPPLHPSDLKTHLIKSHVKTYHHCSICDVIVTQNTLEKHLLENKHSRGAILRVFVCQVCGEAFKPESLQNHLSTHYHETFVYPCWDCGVVYNGVQELVAHAESCKVRLYNISKKTNDTNKMCYVRKRCENCQQTYSFKCARSKIPSLPTDCPNCNKDTPSGMSKLIKCPLCSNQIIYNTSEINDHFERVHKTANISPKVILKRCHYIDNVLKANKMSKLTKAKNKVCANKQANTIKYVLKSGQINTTFTTTPLQAAKPWRCVKCNDASFTQKEQLEEHFRLTHKTSNGGYQCLECGDCFIVKRSFATHMKIEHNVTDIELYIFNKKCYTEEEPPSAPVIVLNEFQCRICLELFENDNDLKKHFRTHGMAFLLENRNAYK